MQLRGLGATSRINLDPDGDGDTQYLFRPYHIALTPDANGTASTPRLSYTAAADLTLTASTEAPSVKFDLSAIRQHSTGNYANQRDFQIFATTHSAVGASVIDDAATVYIDSSPIAGTNMTLTRSDALRVGFGTSRFEQGIYTKNPLVTLDPAGAATVFAQRGSNTLYVNSASASVLSNITLPGASVSDGAGGLTACVVDADGIKITAAAGDFIYIGTSASTSGGYIQSTAIGSCVSIKALDTTNWMATELTGTWGAF